MFLKDGNAKRKAKENICLECGESWLTRIDRTNSGYCRSCLTKGIRNPMFGKQSWNRGVKTYHRRQCQIQKKKDAVAIFGNKCKICNAENLPITNYEFHHVNPKEKVKGISQLLQGKWSKVEEELKKCIMLCANCHKTLEFGDEKLNS